METKKTNENELIEVDLNINQKESIDINDGNTNYDEKTTDISVDIPCLRLKFHKYKRKLSKSNFISYLVAVLIYLLPIMCINAADNNVNGVDTTMDASVTAYIYPEPMMTRVSTTRVTNVTTTTKSRMMTTTSSTTLPTTTIVETEMVTSEPPVEYVPDEPIQEQVHEDPIYIPPVEQEPEIIEESQPEPEAPSYEEPVPELGVEDLPITSDEYILLCNIVAHEYGSDWVSTPEKAKVVDVVMTRVRDGYADGTIYGVLAQPYQFSGFYPSYEYDSRVTQSCKDAVVYYFNHRDEFPGYHSFWGDGTYNHFS